MLPFLLFSLYRIPRGHVRNLVLWMVKKLEHGEFYSITLRKIFKHFHDVDIGMYTHGSCFQIYAADRGTTIGRYCSIARGVRILTENHPLEFKSTHGFFFNPELKYCNSRLVPPKPVTIGNDVWIGFNALILPGVTRIGDGAVIAAGAVVNKEVPPYAVVVGNPARVVRYRFSPEMIQKLLASRWWEKSIKEIAPNIDEYTRHFETMQMAQEGKSDQG
jgi:virginiamycin A acetyltransferase